MQRQAFTRPAFIIGVLVLQFVPLIMFPAESFSPKTQEWWLPVLLAVMILVAVIQLIVRGSAASWPWSLMSFAQGFNIISRLMMLWPHATINLGNTSTPNWAYISLTTLSMLLSALILWYVELPEVRIGLVRD